MLGQSVSSNVGWRERLALPSPDSREGIGLAVALGFAFVYILLFVAQYQAMTNVAFEVTLFSLVISLIGAFALSTMLSSEIATFQRLELELARTVLAYVGSGSPPPSDKPLAGVWRAHVAGSEEFRRMARSHAYALGLFTYAGVLSLAAALLSGLGTVTHVRNVIGIGMFVEWFAFAFLVTAAGAVLATAGFASPVPIYEALAPRRWRRNAGRQEAVEGAVAEVAWLAEYSRGAREAWMSPAGPATIPSWQE